MTKATTADSQPSSGASSLPFQTVSPWSRVAAYLQHGWLRVALIALLAGVVHSPALPGERIWDDNFLALNNPFIKSPVLILEAFRHYLFLDSPSPHYRPIQNISFIVDYFFWNTDTWGFHLTNIFLHAGSAVALYFLLRQLFPTLLARRVGPETCEREQENFSWISWAAFLVALIWAVHPVHSAAVDYISGRADSLAFIFAAGGWLLFFRTRTVARPAARMALYFLAATCGLLALCSREIALIWIGFFIAHLLFVERRISTRVRVCTICCCVAVIALYIGLRQLPGPRPISSGESWSAPLRATMMARSLGDYARLMIFPNHLHMERTVLDPRLYQSHTGWQNSIGSEYLSILGLITLAALIIASIRKGHGQAFRVFGATWFLASYLPISNIVQLNATVAEHWLYLPSVGFLIFLTGCAFELPERFRRLVPCFAVIAIAALSVQSFMRSSDWANEETFYSRTLAAGSHSARVACNLGQVYTRQHDYARAEKIFRQVLQGNPDYSIGQNSLADLYFHQGKRAEAEKLFTKIEADARQAPSESRSWIGALNHAISRHNAGDDEGALAILDKTRPAYPDVWDLIALESELLRKMDRVDPALNLVEGFARDHWWHYRAAFGLGALYAQKGDVKRAEIALRHASRLDVHDAEAFRLMAVIRIHQNRFEEAVQIQQRAIARQPDEPRQYVLLSDALEKMGRSTEAHAALAKASQLRSLAQDPDQPVVN